MIDLDAWTLFSLNADRKPITKWADMEPGEKRLDENAPGVGVVTGAKSGVFVLDWDDTNVPPPDDLPETYTRKTRRGYHFYFQVPGGVRIPTLTKFPCPGWDIRGDGGFAVFAAEGYDVEVDAPISPCPQWLLERIAEYELARSVGSKSDFSPVDPGSELGLRLARAAVEDAKTLPVGSPGERDQFLFRAALQLVRVRGQDPATAQRLLLEHYCPRVPADGRDTVRPERVAYKCQEAVVDGTWSLQPFVQEDVTRWVQQSRPLVEEERRERYNLVDPKRAKTPEFDPNYVPLRSRDMVPFADLSETSFINLNNILATHEKWSGRLSYDSFTEQYQVFQPVVAMENRGFFTDEDVTSVRLWFASELGLSSGSEAIEKALRKTAKDNSYHPVREYLRQLQPVDDPGRVLQDFATRGLGVTDALEVLLVRKFMMGAVRRILEPGIKMDGVLVLKGDQGVGKSSLLYALCPVRNWVQESLPALDSKDASEAIRGRWLVEIAELQAILRRDETTAKDFLSRQEDSYRRPYDKGITRYPRECVFQATTNDTSFLRDPTGARRYWIIETPGVDLAWVRENRDSIWSSALALALTNEEHHLSAEEGKKLIELQKPHEAEDPWHGQIEHFLEGKTYVDSLTDVYLGALCSVPAVATGMKAEAIRNLDRTAQNRVADSMRRLGWDRKKGKKRGWFRKDVRDNERNKPWVSEASG